MQQKQGDEMSRNSPEFKAYCKKVDPTGFYKKRIDEITAEIKKRKQQ